LEDEGWGSTGICRSAGTRRWELICIKTKTPMGKTAKVMSLRKEKVCESRGRSGNREDDLKGQFSQG